MKKLLDGVKKFSVGSRHGFAIMKDNMVMGWGFNMYNQLGNNRQEDLIQPKVI